VTSNIERDGGVMRSGKIWTKAKKSNEETERERKHRELARTAAAEGIVLLRNDGMLPIKKAEHLSKLALFGAGASMTIKGGTGSGEVNERTSVTIWEGLKNAGFEITTEGWLEEYKTECTSSRANHGRNSMKKAIFGGADGMINIMANPFRYPSGRQITDDDVKLSDTDTCIYVIARQAGEGSERNLERHDYDLDEVEVYNITKVAKAYENTIVVINAGSSMDISQLERIEGIGALVYFCQQGMEGGNAFADIVTGKASPSGCLTNTWPKKYGDIPYAMEYSYLKGNTIREEYKEGIYVGYRYFDSFDIEPRFEFGYGLGYTEFDIEFKDISIDKGKAIVTAKVTNIGTAFSGKKVVQLYISCPNGRLVREHASLVAFAKTGDLKPGESEDVSMCFDMGDVAGYDEGDSCYILEKGEYVVWLGESSRRTDICAAIELGETVVTEKCEPICPIPYKLDELKADRNETKDGVNVNNTKVNNNVKRVIVNPSDIPTIEHNYDKPTPKHDPRVTELVKSLTLDEMLKVVMGSGMMGGRNVFDIPGAAANTTSVLYDKGVCNVALCDGPAGLRLQKTSVVYKSAKIKPLDVPVEFLNYLPKAIKKLMLGDINKGRPVYQYTTAFPVGTAMAQTWNVSLMERFGDAVGTEMVEYGATFWLAPAINIHRNPLCGRNFEYYSEDPILTGRMAAAVTRGLQGHKGCYVTIKHFAANNQETNRNRSNSIVGERALREIYLKGYRLAVEAGARSVMTSYNKLNDVYTPNNYDLCTKVLRNEWGFDGVVMTDWFSTGKELASNGLAFKAGNDLIMPGGKSYEKRVRKELKDGVVSEDDIRNCCANVLEAVLDSRIQREMEKRS